MVDNTQSAVFASTLLPQKWSETNAVLFLESIRAFAGKMSNLSIWFYTPDIDKKISNQTIQKVKELDAEIIPFEVDPEELKFPFIAEATAASKAEQNAVNNHDLLIWLTTNTLILKEPQAFLLPEKYVFGYRPVHHKLIGSDWGEPLDEFWSWVYDYCNLSDDDLFPMTSHIDGERIKPYFNAGSFVVRPQERILQTWKEQFLRGYQDPMLQSLYKEDNKYAIFIHQALFTGVVLSMLKHDKMLELPSSYNYPSHLHHEDITDSKPELLDECVTLRHEGFYKDSNWRENLALSNSLLNWIQSKLLKLED